MRYRLLALALALPALIGRPELSHVKVVREEAERHGFGWAYWDDGGKNKGMDVAAGRWVPAVEAALFH